VIDFFEKIQDFSVLDIDLVISLICQEKSIGSTSI